MTAHLSPNSARALGRCHVYDSIAETIVCALLVPLDRLGARNGAVATMLATLAFFNLIGSVKNRIGVAMIEVLETVGKITLDTVLIAPTSVNTGIALAFAVAACHQVRAGHPEFRGALSIDRFSTDYDGAPPRPPSRSTRRFA